MNIQEAFTAVVEYCPNEYAKAYARTGLASPMNDDDFIKDQALYTLSNLGHWRGELARQVKEVLREVC